MTVAQLSKQEVISEHRHHDNDTGSPEVQVALLTARIDRPNPATLVGSGKLEEVKGAADASGADLILVNYALSPGQERNLEKVLQRRVVDRTGLILDIFSQTR